MIANDWKAIALTLVGLFAFGLISDKTQRIAMWIAGILAGLLFLKKYGEVIRK